MDLFKCRNHSDHANHSFARFWPSNTWTRDKILSHCFRSFSPPNSLQEFRTFIPPFKEGDRSRMRPLLRDVPMVGKMQAHTRANSNLWTESIERAAWAQKKSNARKRGGKPRATQMKPKPRASYIRTSLPWFLCTVFSQKT